MLGMLWRLLIVCSRGNAGNVVEVVDCVCSRGNAGNVVEVIDCVLTGECW